MDWRRLDLDGIDELLGHGVYYGAGRSEAAQCAGQSVVVVGAGNSAGQAVLNFANATARVTMLVRGDRLGKTMSAYLIERIEQHPLIDVHLETQLTELHADGGKLTARDLRRRRGQGGDASRWTPSSSASAVARTPTGARASTSSPMPPATSSPARICSPTGAARLLAARSRSAPARDQPRRAVRGRRRAARLDEARRRRRRRGLDGRRRSSSAALPSSVSRSELAAALEHARERTEALLEPLSDEQLTRAGLAAAVAARLGSRPHRPLRGALAPATRRRTERAVVGVRRPLRLVRSRTRRARRRCRSCRRRPHAPTSARCAKACSSCFPELSLDDGDPLLERGFVVGMVVQHELQHAETMAQTLALAGLPGRRRTGRPRSTASGEVAVPGGAVHARLDGPVGVRQRAARARRRPAGLPDRPRAGDERGVRGVRRRGGYRDRTPGATRAGRGARLERADAAALFDVSAPRASPSSTSRSTRPRRTRAGRESACRPRPSGRRR